MTKSDKLLISGFRGNGPELPRLCRRIRRAVITMSSMVHAGPGSVSGSHNRENACPAGDRIKSSCLYPVFNVVFYGFQEAVGPLAIYNPVIKDKGKIHQGPHRNRIAPVGGLNNHGPLLHGPDAEDSRVAFHNNRCSEEGSPGSMVGNRKGSPPDFVHRQGPVSGTEGQVFDAESQIPQGKPVRLADQRNNKPLGTQSHGHTDVDVLVVHHTLVGPGCVDQRMFPKAPGHGVDKIGGQREADPLPGIGFLAS